MLLISTEYKVRFIFESSRKCHCFESELLQLTKKPLFNLRLLFTDVRDGSKFVYHGCQKLTRLLHDYFTSEKTVVILNNLLRLILYM